MDQKRQDRHLPNHFMRNFLRSVEEQMGTYCLHMMLRQSGLDRYIATLPPADDKEEVWFSEYAAFQKGLRDYYGTGARGSLLRVGQKTFEYSCKEENLLNKSKLLAIRALPLDTRRWEILEYLADLLMQPKYSVSIFSSDQGMVFVDSTSPATFLQSVSNPICWSTVGMIREAILFATGEQADIEEIACMGCGADACKFNILV